MTNCILCKLSSSFKRLVHTDMFLEWTKFSFYLRVHYFMTSFVDFLISIFYLLLSFNYCLVFCFFLRLLCHHHTTFLCLCVFTGEIKVWYLLEDVQLNKKNKETRNLALWFSSYWPVFQLLLSFVMVSQIMAHMQEGDARHVTRGSSLQNYRQR